MPSTSMPSTSKRSQPPRPESGAHSPLEWVSGAGDIIRRELRDIKLRPLDGARAGEQEARLRAALASAREWIRQVEPGEALRALKAPVERSALLAQALGGEPMGELFAPLLAEPGFWGPEPFDARSDRSRAIRDLAEKNPASVGRALASDWRYWALRSAEWSERSAWEGFDAPLKWEPAPEPQARPRAKAKPAEPRSRWAVEDERLTKESIEIWREGFESGAIAGLKGRPEGSELLARMIKGSPMERVERAQAAGLDLSALSAEASGALLRSVAVGEDAELELFDRARSARRYQLGEAEQSLRDKLADSAFQRKAARWAKAIELKAPLALIDPNDPGVSARGFDKKQAQGGLGAFAVEARRGGSLKGPVAAALWARLEALARFPPGASAILGEAGLEGESPLRYAFKKGAQASDFGDPQTWRALLWSVDLDASLERARELGVSAKRWSARGDEPSMLITQALALGARAKGLMSLARMGARFEGSADSESVFIQYLSDHKLWREDPKGALEGFLSAAERASPGGAARALSARGAQGEGPMCLAAKALSIPALELLIKKGASLKETDERGRGLGRWGSLRKGAGDTAALQGLVVWLSQQGFDWSAQDKQGATEASWLASRGSPERVIALIKSLPSHQGELSSLALKRMSPPKASVLERALLEEQTGPAEPEPASLAAPSPRAKKRL